MFRKIKEKIGALFQSSRKQDRLVRILIVGILVGATVAFGVFGIAHAQSASTGVCSFGFTTNFSLSACISDGFFAVIYFFSVIAGMFIAVMLWIIEIILEFNINVSSSALVQTGYSVTLGIANLGFVLGIIVVALATILRRETYGIKSILWKIVLMAIFVNFALVIATPIIGFANGLTNYFINALPGGSNSLTGANNNSTLPAGYDNLASGIAGIFQPQRLISPENATGTFLGALGNSSTSAVGANTTTAVGWFGTLIAGVAGLCFSLVTLGLMVITLIVFFVMLLIRYVYLTVLLITAPLAWAAWVFPKTSKYWNMWWDKFIAQAFYPVFLMFFMYLIIATGSSIPAGQNYAIATTTASSGWFSQFTQALGNSLFGNIIGSGLDSLIFIGLMISGLAMASKMAASGSDLAAKVVGSVKNSVQGYAAKKGMKTLRAAGRKTGVSGAISRARRGDIGKGLADSKKLLGIPSVVGKSIQYVTTKTGRALEPTLSNVAMVEAEKKNVPKSAIQAKADLKTGTLNLESTFAWLEKAIKDGELKKTDMIGKETAQQFFNNHQADIKNYGQQGLEATYNKLTTTDQNTRAGDEKIADAVKDGKDEKTAREETNVKVVNEIRDELGHVVYAIGDTVKAVDLINASYRQIAQTMTKSDVGKINVNAMSKEEIGRVIGVFSMYAPALVTTLLKNAKAPALDNIEEVYKDAIDEKAKTVQAELDVEKDALTHSVKLNDIEKKQSVDRIDTLKRDVIQVRIDNRNSDGSEVPDPKDPSGKKIKTPVGVKESIRRAINLNVAFIGGGSGGPGGDEEKKDEGGAKK